MKNISILALIKYAIILICNFIYCIIMGVLQVLQMF